MAAAVFASKFYAAIAEAQPVGVAIAQGSVAVDMLGLDEGQVINWVVRDDIDLESQILVGPH